MNPIEEDRRQAAQMTRQQRQRAIDQAGMNALGPAPLTVAGREPIDDMDLRIVRDVHEDL